MTTVAYGDGLHSELRSVKAAIIGSGEAQENHPHWKDFTSAPILLTRA